MAEYQASGRSPLSMASTKNTAVPRAQRTRNQKRRPARNTSCRFTPHLPSFSSPSRRSSRIMPVGAEELPCQPEDLPPAYFWLHWAHRTNRRIAQRFMDRSDKEQRVRPKSDRLLSAKDLYDLETYFMVEGGSEFEYDEELDVFRFPEDGRFAFCKEFADWERLQERGYLDF